ncbi:MAG TPA: DNA double-strand break repair nuclease NurA [Thermomicrobiaceae bacterium]|nr:DNA double-strand break repair nuclease NurA [Thermomicrobiaceae bacterium]
MASREDAWTTEEGVRDDLRRQPHLFRQLAENALTVSESLRDNYFKNTAQFVTDLRKRISGSRASSPIITICSVSDASWDEVQQEVVTFIDGGVGQIQISSQVPILIRVGSYSVRVGERRLAEREQFGYYPIILGDLEGGSKQRKDFVDIVRITAELLASLSALERTPDLRVLMLHGPLVYLMGQYAGHTPFTENDIDRFLRQYGPSSEAAHTLKEAFLKQARLDIYPQLTTQSDSWARERLFEPLSWIAFLYRQLIHEASQRRPVPVIAGVVERGALSEFIKDCLLKRVFRGLREKNNVDYFNKMYGRTDLTSESALLERLGYTDALLLAMLLKPGDYSESWIVNKYSGLRSGTVVLPDGTESNADFRALRRLDIGFPQIRACYVQASETTLPVRVEVFDDLGHSQAEQAVRRAFLYARLLPGYGFPVGLDIADKYSHVPAWLTDAYSKIIRFQLGVSLQRGEVSDAEMRRILIQAIYMTHRDWLFRPEA